MHSMAVAELMQSLSTATDLDPELAYQAGMLHDIGKLTWPDHLLTASRPLAEEDRSFIYTHPKEGARILSAWPRLSQAALEHHERYDGQGYPRRIREKEIVLLARMISVCDVYNVITERGTYTKKQSTEYALTELEKSKATHLDPELVDLFTELKERDLAQLR
jgi:putative nucleotidyltransferase with HDIG domain